jgi:hypothetical protein
MHGGSKVRSGSVGSLPKPTGAIFVDAKDLLRRRRDDVVFGLSESVTVSRDGSEPEVPAEERHDEDGASLRKSKTVS